jgi:hypothetical protein
VPCVIKPDDRHTLVNVWSSSCGTQPVSMTHKPAVEVDATAVHLVDGHGGHERQVLDQAAGLALGRVRRAQHAPLAGLQAARPAHLRGTHSARFLGFSLRPQPTVCQGVHSRPTSLSRIVPRQQMYQTHSHWLTRLSTVVSHGRVTLRVFSNWELILVIMPSAATNDSLDSTCVAAQPLMLQAPALGCCMDMGLALVQASGEQQQ